MCSPNEVTTIQVAPTPPTDVAVRFGSDGTNVLMWALSEDDGYNDRDVTNYYIWRAILPGGSYTNVGQVAAGVGVYIEANPALSSTQSVSYAVLRLLIRFDFNAIVATVIAPSSVVSTNVVIGLPHIFTQWQLSIYCARFNGTDEYHSNIDEPHKLGVNLHQYPSVCVQ